MTHDATTRTDRNRDPGPDVHHCAFMSRLEGMRVRARRLLVMHGLFALACGSLGMFLALCFLDYTFWFPGVLRLLFATGWVGIIVWLVCRQVTPAVVSRFMLLDVATKIEQRFPEFQDRLTSSVSFLAEPDGVHDPLRLKLIERTEHIAAGLPLEQAISPRPVWRMAWLAALPAALLGLAATLQPAWITTGFLRYAAPLGSVEWPRRIHIEPLTTDLTIATGESVVLAMEVTQGQHDGLRGFLNMRGGRGPLMRKAMRREGSSRYAATLPAVTESFTYWFEAGDDDTRRRRTRVRVVERPEVLNLQLSVLPPPYVESAEGRPLPTGQRFVELIEGGALELRFRASKPLQQREGRLRAAVVAETGERFDATQSEESSGELLVRLQPEAPGAFRIELIDEDGFASAGADMLGIELTPDSAPRARLLQPTETLEVTPTATVRVSGSAEDDLGLNEISLWSEVVDRGDARHETIGGWQAALDDFHRVTTEFTYDWSLDDLRLQVGDELRYALVVQDNRITESFSAQEGRSYELTLRVVSPQALAASVGQELQRLARRLRGFGSRQEQVVARAEALHADIQDGSADDPDAELMGLSAGQRSLAQQLTSIRRRSEALSEQLDLNEIRETPENQQTARFARHLREVVEPTMQEAAGRLNAARAHADTSAQLADMAEAIVLQRRAAGAIEDLLKELAVWDDYNGVMAHLRRLIDLQQQVGQRTAVLQERTLGKEVHELPEELRQELQRSAASQDRISVTLEQALDKLQELEDKLRASRPDEARALGEARRRLASKQAADFSRKAADAIRRNQTGQAQIDQNRVERALAETVSQLENKRTRQLAELGKRLAKVEAFVSSILERQRALLEDTRKNADTTLLPDLGKRQAALRRNTIDAATQIDAIDNAQSAAELTHLAAAHMAEAIEALYDELRDDAVQAEGMAVQRLERALALLEEHREQTEQRLQLQNLLATRRALQDLRRKQFAINAATADIRSAIDTAGRRARKNVRRAKKEARNQEQLLEATRPLAEKLDSAPVYLWVLERVQGAMTTSLDLLARATVDATLTQAQDKALRLLDQLIEAIDQAQAMAEDQFAAGGGGGGSGKQGNGSAKPVPAVAELLVLKAVQQDIHRRTTELADRVRDDSPTEEQLQAARGIGEEQAELKMLTIQLTEQARQP